MGGCQNLVLGWLREGTNFLGGTDPCSHVLCVWGLPPLSVLSPASREGPASEAGKGGGTDGSGAIPQRERAGIPEQAAGSESWGRLGWDPRVQVGGYIW